jgi:hypothetical protein
VVETYVCLGKDTVQLPSHANPGSLDFEVLLHPCPSCYKRYRYYLVKALEAVGNFYCASCSGQVLMSLTPDRKLASSIGTFAPAQQTIAIALSQIMMVCKMDPKVPKMPHFPFKKSPAPSFCPANFCLYLEPSLQKTLKHS